MANIDFENDITDEMYSVVAEALLYRDDVPMALKKAKVCPSNWTMADINNVYRYILKSNKLQQAKDDFLTLEEETLIEDSPETMMLIYNRLLKDAKNEGKFDVVARILKEIRQLKAIENEQMKFEIEFKIQGKAE